MAPPHTIHPDTALSEAPPAVPRPKPVLKWAGGKQQLLPQLLQRVPQTYGRYIEPFLGGGALFFALAPDDAVVADANPELINLYHCLAWDPEAVVAAMAQHSHDEAHFYAVRAQALEGLSAIEAAARTLYLNRTCFNGLYRVNREGAFNVPFGRYVNPKLCDAEALRAAGEALARAEVLCADYRDVLAEHARPGDFVYLDPPYLPAGGYADFKRYTKAQFREADHRALAEEVRRLAALGCHVVLSNAKHPLVWELYGDYSIEVVAARRNISSRAATRRGEEVIVTIAP